MRLKKIIILGLVIRLILLPFTYHGDIEVDYWWGRFAHDFGLRGFYDWLDFGNYGRPDLPMIMIYMCLVIRKVYLLLYQALWFVNINFPPFPSSFMTWFELHGNQTLLKIPMIFADLGLIYIVYDFVKDRIVKKKALILAFLIAIYPPLIYNSAVWGSGDSLAVFFGLGSIWLLLNRKYLISTLFFFSSILFKPTLLSFFPFLLIILIKQKIKLTTLIKIFLFSLLIIYLVSAPFAPANSYSWFINTYLQKILLADWRHQLTANAMNAWSLFYGLGSKPDNLNILSNFSARSISVIVTIAIELLIFLKLFRNFNRLNLFVSISASTLTMFVFMTRMHERYLLPALIPLLISVFYDQKYLKYFLIFSFTHMLNIYHGWWIPQIPWLVSILENEVVIKTISGVNLITTLIFLYEFIVKKEAKNKLEYNQIC